MISITSTQAASKYYPGIGVTLASGETESVNLSCNVESMSISGDTLNIRYSVYVGEVRGAQLLSLSCTYSSDKDVLSQAEDAIKNYYA